MEKERECSNCFERTGEYCTVDGRLIILCGVCPIHHWEDDDDTN